MLTKSFAEISRRRFLAAGSISVAAAWLHPRALFARPGDDLVESALKQAAKHENHRSKTSPRRQCLPARLEISRSSERLKNLRRGICVTKSGRVLVRPKSYCHDVRAGALN